MTISRLLIVINAAGVLLLGALSVAQWRVNTQLNGDVIALGRTNRLQADQLSELGTSHKNDSAMLETLRDQLVSLNALEETNRLKVLQGERQLRQVTAERDQYRAGVDQWQKAVAGRDARLAEVNAQLQSLVLERNDIVLQHNILVTNFNETVARLKVLSGATNGALVR